MNWRRDIDIIFLASIFGLVLFGISGRHVVRAQSDCDIDCLNEKIVALTKRVVALERITTGNKTASARSVSKESFKEINGGINTGSDWTKVDGSDFWFDQSLYGNVAVVTWQGWIENGKGSVRLYDATNGRGVDGSEMTLNANGRASFYSGNLAIWRGQNQYYIQVKNSTLEQVNVTGARLKIVTK